MSASLNGIRAGQPSITQPIAGPWLSPKVVTRKRWPNVLNDMDFTAGGFGSPAALRGQMSSLSTINRRIMARYLVLDATYHFMIRPGHDPELQGKVRGSHSGSATNPERLLSRRCEDRTPEAGAAE